MDWSPDNKNRCDNQLCQYATICNLITLFLILIFITGLAQANMSLDRMAMDFPHHDARHNSVQICNLDKNNISVKEILILEAPEEQRVLGK